MMLNLKTGRVAGYNEGQTPLIYLVTTCQIVRKNDSNFVFSDGHGLATFTDWFDDLTDLSEVDWKMVRQRYWADKLDDSDRQRRKQAEFLIKDFCPWRFIKVIVVINSNMKQRVEEILEEYPRCQQPSVKVKRGWYY